MLFKSFKLYGLLVILLFAVMLTVRTSSAKPIGMDNEKTSIARCYSDMYRYMIAKDTVALSGLLDEDFVLIHMTGMPAQERVFAMYCRWNTQLLLMQ